MALHGPKPCIIDACSWASGMGLRSIGESPRTLPRLLHPSSAMFEAPQPQAKLFASRISNGDELYQVGSGPFSFSLGASQRQARQCVSESIQAQMSCRDAMLGFSRAATRLVLPPDVSASDSWPTSFYSDGCPTVMHSISRALHFLPTLPITSSNH